MDVGVFFGVESEPRESWVCVLGTVLSVLCHRHLRTGRRLAFLPLSCLSCHSDVLWEDGKRGSFVGGVVHWPGQRDLGRELYVRLEEWLKDGTLKVSDIVFGLKRDVEGTFLRSRFGRKSFQGA